VTKIRDPRAARKILLADAILGGGTAIIGLTFLDRLPALLGLPKAFVLVVALVTLLYATVACALTLQKTLSAPLFRALVAANWFWTGVSVVLTALYFASASPLGKAFLVLQILVVGGLAYAEGGQLVSGDGAGDS
jgi:hypothetical protein